MFFEFGIKDIIDIFLVALMLYYLYRLMKESRSLNVFIGIMVFVLVWLFVSQVLEMRLLGSIMDKLVSVGVIGLIVLFKEEIRKFLYQLGAHQRVKNVLQFFSSKKSKSPEEDKATSCPSCGRAWIWRAERSEHSSSLSVPRLSTTSCRLESSSEPT